MAIAVGGDTVAGVIRDVSMGGFRVTTAGCGLAPNEPVRLMFPPDGDVGADRHGFEANVVWAEGGDAGLMLSGYRPETLRILCHLFRRLPANREKD